MTNRVTLTLSWPDKALWQNSNGTHWGSRARATAKARQEAWAVALAEGIAKIKGAPRYTLFVEGYRKTGRGRPPDIQNFAAPLKAYIDGIADALGVDDGRFAVDFPSVWAGQVKGGRVIIHVLPDGPK